MFHNDSYGYRPGHSPIEAVRVCRQRCSRRDWVVDLDVKAFVDSVPWDLMLKAVARHTDHKWVLLYVERWLKAPMLMPDGTLAQRVKRTPQGGTASPILSNIYLDRFDRSVEQSLLPEYNHGQRRQSNRAYQIVEYAIAKAKRHGDRETVQALRRQRRTLPSQDPNDPHYRRLRYVRYCDDWLLGFAGPRYEAEQIKSKIQAFLRDELKLELSQSKTLITHATSQAARFLGYEIRTQHADTKITQGRRAVNAAIGLFVPRNVIRQRCARYMRQGKPALRGQLLHDDDFTIVAKYGSEYRGLAQYYLHAQDVFRLGKLRWVMETSMLKTLAGKHKSTVTKMARKYKTVIDTPAGKRTCFQAPSQGTGAANHWSPASAAFR